MTSTGDEKIVISASRRTDIPAFYMEWFMDRIRRGFFEVENPFSGKTTSIAAAPQEVHSIVFFSKNYGPFLEKRYGHELIKMGFHFYFHFTINSEDRLLEPNVPSLAARMNQLTNLAEQFGSELIAWRFDPVCFYEHEKGLHDNLGNFDLIAGTAENLGIKCCITSFMDDYKKIEKRARRIPGFRFVFPGIEQQTGLLLEMERKLADALELQTCCEKELLQQLPAASKIRSSSCIPNDLLQRLFGGNISLAPDYGQRRNKGCGCKASKDIGSYQLQPCKHNCLYCYANPKL